jgi:hypothetical protein
MITLLNQYWYFILGVTLFLIYGALVIIFFRNYSGDEPRPVPIWWYFALGPVVLLRTRANESGQKKLLTSREQFGWMVVVAFMVIVVIWKLVSKL